MTDRTCQEIAQDYVDTLVGLLNGKYDPAEYVQVEEDEQLTGEEALCRYIEEALDLQTVRDLAGELCSVQAMHAYGGPGVWSNFALGIIVAYWWNDKGVAFIPSDVCEVVNNYFADLGM